VRTHCLHDLDGPVLCDAERRQDFLKRPPFPKRPDHGRRRRRPERRSHRDGRRCGGRTREEERAPTRRTTRSAAVPSNHRVRECFRCGSLGSSMSGVQCFSMEPLRTTTRHSALHLTTLACVPRYTSPYSPGHIPQVENSERDSSGGEGTHSRTFDPPPPPCRLRASAAILSLSPERSSPLRPGCPAAADSSRWRNGRAVRVRRRASREAPMRRS